MTTESVPVKKKRKSRWWLTVLILLAIVGAIILFNNYSKQQDLKATIADLRTTSYSRATLQTVTSGTGNVRPRQSVVLVWQSSGTVSDIDVAVGDTVETDQILLSLDENNLSADIIQASLNKITATQALESLESNILLQRATLNNSIETAQTAITDLETQLLNLESRKCESWRVDNLQTEYDNALEAYQNWSTESGWNRVQIARVALNYCDPDVINQQIDSLNSQLDMQKQNKAIYEQDLEKIQFGPDPDEVEKLELQLSLAEKQLANQYIKAPFDGTVLSVSQESGDLVTAGTTAVVIADLSELFIDVPISEVDIPTIEVGQAATLTFDAYYNEEFTGVVSNISENADRSTGVVNYSVTIRMENQSDKIKSGMTAAVSILTAEKTDAYVVPTTSTFTRDGQDYVYVLREGVPEMVEVTLGSYSNQQIEVIDADIDDGELIVVNPPNDIISNFGFAQRLR